MELPAIGLSFAPGLVPVVPLICCHRDVPRAMYQLSAWDFHKGNLKSAAISSRLNQQSNNWEMSRPKKKSELSQKAEAPKQIETHPAVKKCFETTRPDKYGWHCESNCKDLKPGEVVKPQSEKMPNITGFGLRRRNRKNNLLQITILREISNHHKPSCNPAGVFGSVRCERRTEPRPSCKVQ